MGSQAAILVVDDLDENIRLLTTLLRTRGYETHTAHSGLEALEEVERVRPDAVVLDLVMPELDGFEVCRTLKNDTRTSHIPVIIVTGSADHETNVKALEMGADDFLTRPIDAALLDARIRNVVRAKAMQEELINYKQQLEEYNGQLESRIDERTAELERTQHLVVFSLARLAESRDPETGQHLERMRRYARELALTLASRRKYEQAITDDFIDEIFHSAPLHDIGKVGIPDRILLKPGKLTTYEFDVMKTHAVIGGDTLHAADAQAGRSFLTMGREIAYFHHERWDGGGYPEGRSGQDIPLSARIVALADVYDALTSRRPYKRAFTHEESKQIILEGRGAHMDPAVVDAFLECELAFMRIQREYQDKGEMSLFQKVMAQLDEYESGASN